MLLEIHAVYSHSHMLFFACVTAYGDVWPYRLPMNSATPLPGVEYRTIIRHPGTLANPFTLLLFVIAARGVIDLAQLAGKTRILRI
ncbi:MAG: hypothetical protein CMJ42_21830 [Phyllobacteriaceae bacterium]|nr:hypothetical protein [Phyllobacteriaceae bacterium]MBA92555.1 hypothetical protein [Phyllobacteriaceae bacterium]